MKIIALIFLLSLLFHSNGKCHSLYSSCDSTALPKSCQEIKQRMLRSASGVYLIAANEMKAQYVYCHMEPLCGTDGGWTRLAYINMTDTSENCPNGWRLYHENGVKACGRPDTPHGSCSSVSYPSHGVTYTEICGKVRGYQYYSPDAVDSTIGTSHNDINSHYVDGLSLTRGSPRQHVWTYMCGVKEDSLAHGRYSCPCQTGSEQTSKVPKFIGDNYYCESGNPAGFPGAKRILYTNDPLWDNKQCNGLESSCCNPASPMPWFHRVLDSPTNDYIEARVCGDQKTADEDTPIEMMEIYVK